MARSRKKSSYYDSPGLFDIIDEEPETIMPLEVTPTIQPLKYISFGSGSSGNCAYLGNDRAGLLIDAGVDPEKYIYPELKRNGIEMTSIGGIILTHDHGDHVKFAYSILRQNRHMRLYTTPKTFAGILRRHNVSRRIKDYHQPIFKEISFKLAHFTITPFEVSHDGTDNVGFHIAFGSHNFVVATDLGFISERADYYIRKANYLMIETNYDRRMLLEGQYPEYLKARILSSTGHLDNVVTAKYLAEISSPLLQHIFLCHLSNDNNTPEVALATVRAELQGVGLSVGDGSGSLRSRDADVQLMALPRFSSTGLIILRQK